MFVGSVLQLFHKIFRLHCQYLCTLLVFNSLKSTLSRWPKEHFICKRSSLRASGRQINFFCHALFLGMEISLHSTYPSFPTADVRKICTMAVDTKEMLLNGRPLQSFFSIKSQCSPCISIGSSNLWQSINNHNRTCERFIGIMKEITQRIKIRDKPTYLAVSDEKIRNRMCLLNINSFMNNLF